MSSTDFSSIHLAVADEASETADVASEASEATSAVSETIPGVSEAGAGASEVVPGVSEGAPVGADVLLLNNENVTSVLMLLLIQLCCTSFTALGQLR